MSDAGTERKIRQKSGKASGKIRKKAGESGKGGSARDKKLVAYLLEYPLDLPGGAQMSTVGLCTDLADSAYEPVVVCPELLGAGKEDFPFRIYTYGMGENRLKNLFIRIMAFRRIIAELEPDIVHIQMPESLVTYALAGIRSEKRGGPVLIFTDRGLFYGYRKHTMLMMKLALRKARLLLTTTRFNRRLWEEGSGFHDIRTIANTISGSFDNYDEEKRSRRYAERGGLLTLGLAGRICEEKNWPFAVRLIKLISDRGVDFRVSLVLSVFEKGDDRKVRAIIKGIEYSVGRDRLEFRQDLSQDEMQDYYYGVDVFVMTSRFESFGKAAVEAMSRKCAVIATDVGGLSEVIGKSENLYTEQTPEKAVDYIEHAASDPEFLRAEQEYFYSRYLEKFSRDRCAGAHIALYNEVTAKTKA